MAGKNMVRVYEIPLIRLQLLVHEKENYQIKKYNNNLPLLYFSYNTLMVLLL